MFYFVIDLRNKKKDIRKFISIIEDTIIQTLKKFGIESHADKKNIGIWYNKKSNTLKVGAIGLRVSKWIAYHGFAINVNNNIENYNTKDGTAIRDFTHVMDLARIHYLAGICHR